MLRKTFSGLILIVLLTGILTSTINIQPVKASGTIYIRADGSIDPPTAPITTTDNVTYTFTGNINDSIVVERNNIIINGNGYTLRGNGSQGPPYTNGFSLDGITNVEIKNTQVEGFFRGVFLYSSTNNTIVGCNITANFYGITLEPYLYPRSNYNNISGNNIERNTHGIALEWGSKYNSISGNNITNNEIQGIIVGGWYTIISGNDVTNNHIGVSIDCGDFNNIYGNNIKNNSDSGIVLDNYSSDNIIYRNNIENDCYGIRFSNCNPRYVPRDGPNYIFENNITKNAKNGFVIYTSSSNVIYHNNISKNGMCRTDTQVWNFNSTSTWDNGYPSGGNYWSDHEFVDAFSGSNQDELGSDGICDTPYIIDENNQDNYPLMSMVTPTHPIPTLVSVNYPYSIETGEWATITVKARNDGKKADEMYISVSFPENPPIDNIQIVSHDLQDAYILPVESEVWADYGTTYPIILEYPLVEGFKEYWEKGETKTLQLKVKPQNTGTFRFFVKTTAQVSGEWSYYPQSGTKDQQNEYVYIYYVNVDTSKLPVQNLNTGLNYETIQDAIDADDTLDGHTIFVNEGVYHEHLFVVKSLSITGENRDRTIIDGDGTGPVVMVSANNTNITGFTIKNSSTSNPLDSCLDIGYVSNCCVRGNNIENSHQGILLSGSSNSFIFENKITNTSYGVYLSSSFNVSIVSNEIAGNTLCGIFLDNSSNSSINGNRLTDNHNGLGILVSCSNNTRISRNYITCNRHGISLWDSSLSIIRDNNVTANWMSGVSLWASTNNVVARNNVTGDSEYGIYVNMSSNYNRIYENSVRNNKYGLGIFESNDNIIYHDDFLYNTNQAVVEDSVSSWDNGYPSGGNFWSDYVEKYPDAREVDDSDIWDTPYVIDANNQDDYPLMKPCTTQVQAKWTYMVYLDGDIEEEEEAIRDFNEMEEIGSTSDVNIIVLIDRIPGHDSSSGDWAGTRLYYVTKDDDTSAINSQLLEDLGEKNMGDDETLCYLINYAKNNYPAKRYALILMNHGEGFRKLMTDKTNADSMNMIELKRALANADLHIDVLAFEACLMGMVEVAYQIKDYADFMVGSENPLRSAQFHWHLFAHDKILSALTTNPSMNGRELAGMIVDKFRETYKGYLEQKQTLSAIDLSQIVELATKVNNLASALTANLDVYSDQVKTVRSLIANTNEEYGKRTLLDPQDDLDYIDLYYYVQMIKQSIKDVTIQNLANDLMDFITEKVIVAEWHQILHPNSHGLSISFPETIMIYRVGLNYDYGKLDFALINSNGWDEFIKQYLEKVSCEVYMVARYMPGVELRVDGFIYSSPMWLGLFKGTHLFSVAPLVFFDSKIWVVFDHWEDEDGITIDNSPTFYYNLQTDRQLWAVYRSLLSGTMIQLTESQSKIYLHVYDNLGHHTGLNYETNLTEIHIPESFYFDFENGTIVIIIPENVSEFRVVVDAKYAEDQFENYNLTLSLINDSQISNQTYVEYSLQKGGQQEFVCSILPNGKIQVTPLSGNWSRLLWIVLAVVLVSFGCASLIIIWYRRRNRNQIRLSSTSGLRSETI